MTTGIIVTIPASEVLGIFLAAGRKPRHAQNWVVREVNAGNLVVLPGALLGEGNLTLEEAFSQLFAEKKIDVDTLIDSHRISFDTKRLLYSLTQETN